MSYAKQSQTHLNY